MHIRWNLAVVIGLLGAVVACGGDSTDERTSVPNSTLAPTTAPVASVPSDDVTAMLLTAEDLGSGWQEGHEVGEADFRDSWQIPCDDVAVNPTLIDRLRPSAGTQFEPIDGSSRHVMELVTTGVEDELAAALDAYIGAVGSCPPGATWDGAAVTVTPLELGELGDQRAAYISVATESGGNAGVIWHVRNASMRVGGHIVSLWLAEILESDGAQPAVSDTEFVEMARTAVGKFGG